MNKLKKLTIFALAAFAIGTLAACQRTANTNTAANTNVAVTGSNTNVAATPAPTETKAESTGSLATPTDVYRTAYDLRKKKDIEGLKKVMSKDILDFLKMMGEDDKKSLDDMLRDLCEQPQAATAESRNEKITGDTATLEYLDEDGGWQTMDFEKIGNEWKMAPPKGPMKSEAPNKKP